MAWNKATFLNFFFQFTYLKLFWIWFSLESLHTLAAWHISRELSWIIEWADEVTQVRFRVLSCSLVPLAKGIKIDQCAILLAFAKMINFALGAAVRAATMAGQSTETQAKAVSGVLRAKISPLKRLPHHADIFARGTTCRGQARQYVETQRRPVKWPMIRRRPKTPSGLPLHPFCSPKSQNQKA